MSACVETTELSLEQQLRIQAAVEDRPVSALIDDAIRCYLQRPERIVTKHLLFRTILKNPPIKASLDEVKAILEVDYYEQ